MSPGIENPDSSALPTPAAPSAPEPRDFPRGRESSGEIPGHIDHVPRKGPANLSSTNLSGYPKGRSATGEIPSDISQVPRKCRSPILQTRPVRSPAPTSRDRLRSPGPPGSTMPGYAGYVPKVGPRNILGLTFKAAADAVAERSADAPPDTDRTGSTTTRTLPEGRVGIPGYAGYIPKKGPTNVIGATYRAGADRAARGLDPVNEAVTENRRLEEGASLWKTDKPAGMIIGNTVGAETSD